MRSVYKAWWLAFALVGCAADDGAKAGGLGGTASPIFAQLSPDGDDNTVFVRPQETRTLSVRLLTAKTLPLADQTVEFALLDGAKGASIDVQSATTDELGRTSVQLTAGTTATTFSLRASFAGAEPLIFTITVREARDPTLQVRVRYAGMRPVAQRSVTVVPSMTCAQVIDANAIGDKTYSFSAVDERASFVVGSGMRYAVAAWGRDDTGGRLARGCVEQATGISAEDVVLDVDVDLADEPLLLTGDFPWVVDAQLAGIGAAMSPLLDTALENVAATYAVADEPGLVVERLRRDFTSLGGTPETFEMARPLLVAALATRDRARDFPAAYAALAEQRMASLSVTGVLHVRPGKFTVDVSASQCTDATAMWNVALPNVGTAKIDATFAVDRAAIAIAALQLPIALDSVINALTVGRAEADPGALGAALVGTASCALFPAALAGLGAFTAVCDAGCIAASCRAVVDALLTETSSQLRAAEANALVLSGDLATHARDSTAVVDLGPTALPGSFGDVLSLSTTMRSSVASSAAL